MEIKSYISYGGTVIKHNIFKECICHDLLTSLTFHKTYTSHMFVSVKLIFYMFFKGCSSITFTYKHQWNVCGLETQTARVWMMMSYYCKLPTLIKYRRRPVFMSWLTPVYRNAASNLQVWHNMLSEPNNLLISDKKISLFTCYLYVKKQTTCTYVRICPHLFCFHIVGAVTLHIDTPSLISSSSSEPTSARY